MDMINKLKEIPLLSNISDNDLKALSNLIKENHHNKGDIIINEGDVDSKMYILINGEVDIIKTTIFGDKFVCATLKDNMHAIFGEMALIDNDKRSATVIAKTDCDTLSIDNESFNKYCDLYPSSAVKLLKLMNLNLIRNLRAENENLKLVYQALIEEIEYN